MNHTQLKESPLVCQFGPIISLLAGIVSRVTLEELSLQAEALEEALRGARHDEVVLVPIGVQTAMQMLTFWVRTSDQNCKSMSIGQEDL